MSFENTENNDVLNALLEGQPLTAALGIPTDLTEIRQRWFDTNISALEMYCWQLSPADTSSVLAIVRERINECHADTLEHFLAWARVEIQAQVRAFELFTRFFTKYQGVVRNGVRAGLIGTEGMVLPSEVEEVVQQAWHKIFQQLHRFQERTEPETRAWLKRVAKFEAQHCREKVFTRLEAAQRAMAKDQEAVITMGSGRVQYALNDIDANRGLDPEFKENGCED